jgi:protein-disulfide isomerase
MRSRRLVLAMVAALAAAPALARAPASPPADFSLGSAKAKVHVVEYASLSCPHCARFNAEVFPAFKAKYVDTGKVRYTLREVLTPPAEVAAAGFLLARCAGPAPASYFKVVDEVFRSQSRWQEGQTVLPILLQIGRDNGLSEAQVQACIHDKAAIAALEARVGRAIDAGVEGTPTFFVNGRKIAEGEVTLKQLDAAVAAAGKRGG